MNKKKYKIIKVMNNNVIRALNIETDQENVLIGKGIGFGQKKKKTVSIDHNDIEKMFVTSSKKIMDDYIALINTIDDQLIEIISESILEAEEVLGSLNSRIHVVLTDHISFALERLRQGMTIENPFIHEIKTLYKEEFKLASQIRKKIKEKLKIDIGEGEVGFITLHLNAAKENKEVKEALKYTRLINDLINIIEDQLAYKIVDSIAYNRLVDHLRGCITRVEKDQIVKNPLIETLKEEFPESFNIALKIKEKLDAVLIRNIPEGELGYLTIHISRIAKNKEM